MVTKNPQKRCDLEPNHTHFLLFDDGNAKADAVLDLRANIETRCRAVNTDPLTGGIPGMLIPIVMVLVEGGPSSLRTICKALDAKTPVVVVKVTTSRSRNEPSSRSPCFSRTQAVAQILSLTCTRCLRRATVAAETDKPRDRQQPLSEAILIRRRSTRCKRSRRCCSANIEPFAYVQLRKSTGHNE